LTGYHIRRPRSNLSIPQFEDYLPPYSHDMNPIEKAYSKLKAFPRKIAERTVAGLLIALYACADNRSSAPAAFMSCSTLGPL
jgi:transposase